MLTGAAKIVPPLQPLRVVDGVVVGAGGGSVRTSTFKAERVPIPMQFQVTHTWLLCVDIEAQVCVVMGSERGGDDIRAVESVDI